MSPFMPHLLTNASATPKPASFGPEKGVDAGRAARAQTDGGDFDALVTGQTGADGPVKPDAPAAAEGAKASDLSEAAKADRTAGVSETPAGATNFRGEAPSWVEDPASVGRPDALTSLEALQGQEAPGSEEAAAPAEGPEPDTAKPQARDGAPAPSDAAAKLEPEPRIVVSEAPQGAAGRDGNPKEVEAGKSGQAPVEPKDIYNVRAELQVGASKAREAQPLSDSDAAPSAERTAKLNADAPKLENDLSQAQARRGEGAQSSPDQNIGLAGKGGPAAGETPPGASASASKAAPGAAVRPDAIITPPADPKPADAAIEAAADQAVFKRTASPQGSADEPAMTDGRRASDVVAARAPGEQVRAAARAAGQDTGAAQSGRAENAGSAEVRPDNATVRAAAPSHSSAAPPPFTSALVVPAHAQAQLAAMGIQAGGETAQDAEAELTLETSSLRADARGEVQRHSMPQAANAHASARFQPQTVQTLAARIAARAVEGGRVFDIRLDPAELGRVEVRLEMGADNSVRALLSAERADTLAELQRSARDLEKALADAGLDLADDGLSFSLSDQGADARDEGGEPRFDAAVWTQSEGMTGQEALSAAPTRLYGFELAARRGLDLRT